MGPRAEAARRTGLRRSLHRADGATAVEYAVMVAGIAVAVVAMVLVLGQTLRDDMYDPTAECLEDLPVCAESEGS